MQTISATKFTSGQLFSLLSTLPGRPVKDIRTLKKLRILGVVKFHEHTGEIVRNRIFGGTVRAWYIDEAEQFEVEGIGIFRERYFSGSIFPYLIRAELDEQGQIKY